MIFLSQAYEFAIMYVNFSNKDSNIHFIIEELEKTNTPKSTEIVSLYKQVITSQTPT